MKRNKAKPKTHKVKRLYLESCWEMVLVGYHSPTGKMSVKHFPGINNTSMGNVFNDSHQTTKTKDEHNEVRHSTLRGNPAPALETNKHVFRRLIKM